jgi:hypothetical protein
MANITITKYQAKDILKSFFQLQVNIQFLMSMINLTDEEVEILEKVCFGTLANASSVLEFSPEEVQEIMDETRVALESAKKMAVDITFKSGGIS